MRKYRQIINNGLLINYVRISNRELMFVIGLNMLRITQALPIWINEVIIRLSKVQFCYYHLIMKQFSRRSRKGHHPVLTHWQIIKCLVSMYVIKYQYPEGMTNSIIEHPKTTYVKHFDFPPIISISNGFPGFNFFFVIRENRVKPPIKHCGTMNFNNYLYDLSNSFWKLYLGSGAVGGKVQLTNNNVVIIMCGIFHWTAITSWNAYNL